MEDRASICWLLIAAITVGIFIDCIAGLPTFNETRLIGIQAPGINFFTIKPVIRKLAATKDQPNSPTVNFYSYTIWNPTIPDLLPLDKKKLSSQLRASYFDASRTTVFLADGWMTNGSSEMCTRLCREYVKYNDANVIVVEWKNQTFPTEESVATQVQAVAQKIAMLTAKLVIRAHLDLNDTIFVGFSMGAHVLGAAGRILKGLIGIVVGLDPSVSTYQAVYDYEKLNRSSGKYVQVIHTNGGNLGLSEAIGSADFFANNGIDQPGCLGDNVCSHKRAWQYFAESINSVSGFYSTKCSSHEYLVDIQTTKNYVLSTCSSQIYAKMGGRKPDHKAQGIFSFETASQTPFLT